MKQYIYTIANRQKFEKIISLSENSRMRRIKDLPTTLKWVHGNKSIFKRNQHVRMDKDDRKNKFDRSRDLHKMPDTFDKGKMENLRPIKSRGYTEDGMMFEYDNKTYFFKPITGEKFGDGTMFVRKSIRLNDMDNNPIESTSRQFNRTPDKYKGWQADREHASSILADYLNMDHVAPTKRSNVPGLGEGTVSMNVGDMHKGKNVMTYNSASYYRDFHDEKHNITKYDNNITDKAIFDHLIGNTDRHGGNQHIGVDTDGNRKMLAFDQGFSFPNDNGKYEADSYRPNALTGIGPNQQMFWDIAKKGNQNVSQDFAHNLIDFVQSGDIIKYADMVTETIGKLESDAFVERVTNVYEHIIKPYLFDRASKQSKTKS